MYIAWVSFRNDKWVNVYFTDLETEKSKMEEDDVQDDGKVASFTVLLHGSLKVEGMVALTKVR